MAGNTGTTLTKIVWQYTEKLPDETMEFLKEIAVSYGEIKKYIYRRYAGVGGFGKLASVYEIMGEVRRSGIRTRLNLPSAYFDPAVVDAVSDLKTMWGTVKNKVSSAVTGNENLNDADRLYLRTVLKLDQTYAAILNHEPYEMPKKTEGFVIDTKRLNSLLCRLTRKYLKKPEINSTDYFCVTPGGYSYKENKLFLVSRVRRQRIPLPLKDSRTSSRQLRVCIRENDAVLAVPVEARRKKHGDYVNTVYVHIGYKDMFTLSNGHIYGQSLDSITAPETERLTEKNRERAKVRHAYNQSMETGNREKADSIEANNMGMTKYSRQRERQRARTQTFINTEINRMIAVEKPGTVVITKPVTVGKAKLPLKAANRNMARSFQGYIRERLSYKCSVNSIELVQINSKGTGSVCSNCGETGTRGASGFTCESCGFHSTIPLNGAKNIENRYIRGKQERP